MNLAWLRISDAPVGYAAAYEEQQRIVKLRQNREITDGFWLLEHSPVYTYGRSTKVADGQVDHLKWDEALRAAAGVELFETDRGGDITYHGPGQIVGYGFVDLSARGNDIHRYLRDLEEAIILTLAQFGFQGIRIPGRTGVWVKGAKVCAMGIRVAKWVTMHGFALNVQPQLQHFNGIVPCGIGDAPVTSLALLLGRSVTIDEVRPILIQSLEQVFDFSLLPE